MFLTLDCIEKCTTPFRRLRSDDLLLLTTDRNMSLARTEKIYLEIIALY